MSAWHLSLDLAPPIPISARHLLVAFWSWYTLSMLHIGLSCCFLHPDPQRNLFKGKTLLYMEQSLVHWIAEEGVLVSLIPTMATQPWVEALDGLFLHGGDDVAPQSYGETPLRPEWGGDPIRDKYDIDLIGAFRKAGKPIFGLCRGIQILNVALGGTLYQDLETQMEGAWKHRLWETYENNLHEAKLEPEGIFARLYPNQSEIRINSIHHQGIRDLAPGLKVEARSLKDGVIEAVSGENLIACQWHPEFATREPTLDGKPMLHHFLELARKAKEVRGQDTDNDKRG